LHPDLKALPVTIFLAVQYYWQERWLIIPSNAFGTRALTIAASERRLTNDNMLRAGVPVFLSAMVESYQAGKQPCPAAEIIQHLYSGNSEPPVQYSEEGQIA